VHRVGVGEVRSWLEGAGGLAEYARAVGREPLDAGYLEDVLGLPVHLSFLLREMEERGETDAAALASIPFYSLCRGLFLPLSAMRPEKVAQLFGLEVDPPPGREERLHLLERLFSRDLGLTPVQKVACLLGDPFEGRPGTFRRDSLLRLLLSLSLTTRRQLLDRLTVVGDVAVLFAESRSEIKSAPPLTAAEVLGTLRLLPDQRRLIAYDLLRSLLRRCGKLEAYFLAKLTMRKLSFGLRYERGLLARLLGGHYGVPEEQLAHAAALSDLFEVVRVLEREGAEGLRRIHLQPLVPVRPALAAGTTDQIDAFPVWVERKYDGIRLMLHKSTDAMGTALCGAYSRSRGDYLEMITGLDATIRVLGARSAIVDGELYGTLATADGVRPATVYEVFGAVQHNVARPIALRYAAFDLLYLNGEDLTRLPLSERRRRLSLLVAPLATFPLPVPVTLAEGQMAASKEDLSRLYHHFRAQGYEGILAKDPQGPYRLASRDPSWRKRKPEVTLDLVVLGAVYAVTTKEKAGMFGSYVIGARNPDGSFEDVGDVAGVDRVRDAEIQQLIMTEGLLTGQRIERQSASGVRPGLELRPHIVATVRFEGIVRETGTGRLRLRDPKLAALRADKEPYEADTVQAIEELHLRQRVG
jgi:DNA ligase-1